MSIPNDAIVPKNPTNATTFQPDGGILTEEDQILVAASSEALFEAIKSSSFYRKQLSEADKSYLGLNQSNHEVLIQFYKQACQFARESIAYRLYPITCGTSLSPLKCKPLPTNPGDPIPEPSFIILARVPTKLDRNPVANTSHTLSFTLLDDYNLSHFPGPHLMAYSDIQPSMIKRVSPHPIAHDSPEYKQLPIWLDIDDLREQARQEKSYCQLKITPHYVPPLQRVVRCSRVLAPKMFVKITTDTQPTSVPPHVWQPGTLRIIPAGTTFYQVFDPLQQDLELPPLNPTPSDINDQSMTTELTRI